MEIGWQGFKVKIKLVSFRERNLRFLGIQNLQSMGSKVEDEEDVATRSEKATLEMVNRPDFFMAWLTRDE